MNFLVARGLCIMHTAPRPAWVLLRCDIDTLAGCITLFCGPANNKNLLTDIKRDNKQSPYQSPSSDLLHLQLL